MLAEVPSLRDRLSLLIQWTCVPKARRRRDPRRVGAVVRPVGAGVPARRGQGGPDRARRPLAADDRRRAGIGGLGGTEAHVDAKMFALEFAALLDGLSIQVALEDPEVDSEVAYQIAMRFAERELDLPPAKKAVSARNARMARQQEWPQEEGHRPPALNSGQAERVLRFHHRIVHDGGRATGEHPHRVLGTHAVHRAAGTEADRSGPGVVGHLDHQARGLARRRRAPASTSRGRRPRPRCRR